MSWQLWATVHLRYLQDLLNTKNTKNTPKGSTLKIYLISYRANPNPKKYWSLLKIILNDKRIHCIPPNYHNDKFASDIKKKCDLFNSYFAEQDTPLVNNIKLLSVLTICTVPILESFHFSADHVGEISEKLDPNKAH